MTDTRSNLATAIESLEDFIALPGGVRRLQQLISDAAIQGLLTRRVEAEGTGHDFLNSLDPGSATSSKLKTVRSSTRSSSKRKRTVAGDPDFPLPDHWAWAPLDDLVISLDSARVPLSVAEREGRRGEFDYYGASGVIDSIDDYLFDGDLLLVGEDGANLINRSTPIAFIASGRYWVNNHAHVLDTVDAETMGYLALFLNTIDLEPFVTGTAQPKMNQSRLHSIPVPVPPLEEQARIVETVAELFEVVEQLVAGRIASEDIRTRFATQALLELSDRDSDLALDHLDMVAVNVADVRLLESAVLDLAMRGALSGRGTAEQSASKFLESLDGQLDSDLTLRDKAGRPMADPYPLPEGWAWAPLGSLLTSIQGGWSPAAQARPKEADEWGVLKVSACSWGVFRPQENKALEVGQAARVHLEVEAGDFLISRANTSALVARSVVVDETPRHLMLSDKTLRLTPVEGVNVRYLNYANLAPAARAHYEVAASGTSASMQNVSQKAIRRTPIALPPLAEQDRIVAVIEQAFALMAQLKMQLVA